MQLNIQVGIDIMKYSISVKGATGVYCVKLRLIRKEQTQYVSVSGHEGAAVLLPGFAIIWKQNQVTKQPHLRDLTQLKEREAVGDIAVI